VIERMGDVEIVLQSGTDLLTHPSWDAFAAAEGTAFHTRRFLLSWWHDRLAKHPASRLLTAQVRDGDQVIGACAFELTADVLAFAGGRDVVDYMGPIASPGREKEVAATLARWIFDTPDWNRVELAGLVHDAPIAAALTDEILRLAPHAVVSPYDQAPRIDEAPQGYLPMLNSKRRADILRKRARLSEAVGALELVDSTCATIDEAARRLLEWKSSADPAMGVFVAEYGDFVRGMLAELAAVRAGYVVELHAEGRPIASVILLRHRDTAAIYNMAYDTSLAAPGTGLAPGVVLISLLIERSLDQGLRFDFLKGAQDYKLRLGGVPVDLVGITVER